MSINERFRVHKTGETIQLHGLINDTCNLKVLDEMVSDQNRFDCSNIVGASWNGLLRLDTYFSKLKGAITLARVPFHVFQYLRLLPKLNVRYTLEDIELTLLGKDPKSADYQTRFLSTSLLSAISSDSASPFLHLSDGERIIGRDAFVCPSRFGHREYNHDTLKSLWYQQNTEQFDFWYDYCSFANITLSLALDLVHSQESSLDMLLKEIDLGVTSVESSLTILIPGFTAEGGRNLTEVSQIMRKSCSDLARVLEKSSVQGSELLVRMQLLAEDRDFSQNEALYKVLEEFAQSIDDLKPTMAQIENIGETTGSQIAALGRISAYKPLILGIDFVDTIALESIREILDIMDPLSEGDWDETRSQFLENLQNVDQSLSKIIILLQGFDLLRQILEHRLHESDTIQDFLKRGGNDWRSTKAAVFSLVHRTLVTDQEKYSCEFFIPEASRTEDNNQKPGASLFF